MNGEYEEDDLYVHRPVCRKNAYISLYLHANSSNECQNYAARPYINEEENEALCGFEPKITNILSTFAHLYIILHQHVHL